MPPENKIRFRHVAFLRGINVGGRSVVAMAELKAVFERLGFANVRTVLASGNVMFASGENDRGALTARIMSGLKEALKNDIGVIVRSADELEALRASDPFRGVRLTPDIRLYVTFLPDGAVRKAKRTPQASPDGAFRVMKAGTTEVFSVVDLARGKGTPEAMAALEKEFGTGVTTRNWNTVLKLLA